MIAALGDSTTAGTPGFRSPREAPPGGKGNEESQYAYWIMKEHPAWKVINLGINGQRSDEMLRRFDADVTALGPDTVIVLAGVNDLFQGREVEEILDNLKAIYEKAKNNKIKVVACTILPYNGMSQKAYLGMRSVNQWIKDYAEKNGLTFCDTSHLLEDAAHPGTLSSTSDSYHPDVPGYRKMGELIARNLEADPPAAI